MDNINDIIKQGKDTCNLIIQLQAHTLATLVEVKELLQDIKINKVK